MASNSVLNEVMSEEKLVEIWPDHPCLYDVRSADFKDRDKRQKALEEIALAVNQNGNIKVHEYLIFVDFKMQNKSRSIDLLTGSIN